jgi:hypothetical protein
MAIALPLPRLPRRERTSVPRSQAERLWMIGGGVVAFVLFLIGYFFFISPQRSQTSDVNSQVATTRTQNQALQHRIDLLREQNTNLAKYQAELVKARLALPRTSDLSDFLRSLQALGSATLTDVTALTVGVPKDVSAVAAGTASTAPTAAATTSPAPAASPGAAAPAAQVPGATTPAVFALPITAVVYGSPGGLEKFLDQLQNVQPRAVLITQIAEGVPSSATAQQSKLLSGQTSLQITLAAFVAPSNPSESASLAAAAH